MNLRRQKAWKVALCQDGNKPFPGLGGGRYLGPMNVVPPKAQAELIAHSEELAQLCAEWRTEDFVAIDTEFLRDKTYWPQLCLVQIAGRRSAAAIDTLAPGIDLAPLFDLLADAKVTKVFHAARQDIEIFFHLTDRIPTPLIDTQVVAMVCGFGESASYETLAGRLAHARIDKSSRFTDWARRPLTRAQLAYALSDVTHLRVVHEKLASRIAKEDRQSWVADEMAQLPDPKTYRLDPDLAWARLKPRSDKPRFLAVLKELAAWREREAQLRDLPRNRIVKDESLLEIAAHPPHDADSLAQCRGFSRSLAEGKIGEAILEAVRRGLAIPEAEAPRLAARSDPPTGIGPLVELLRVLLKLRCDEQGVAHKLIASAADLEAIAADDAAPVAALQGWRREIFGAEALALKHGRIGLAVKGRKITTIDLTERA